MGNENIKILIIDDINLESIVAVFKRNEGEE